MSDKSVLIVGAGVAGLAAGCYLQMNGFESQILEMNDKPGGLCTSWVHDGYTIDGCLRWLIGTSPDSNYHHFWEELGLGQVKCSLNLDQLLMVETIDGRAFTLYTNIDRLEQQMLEFAPEDRGYIHEYTGLARRFAGFGLPVDKALELYNTFDNLKIVNKMRPYIKDLQKWSQKTVKDFAEGFQNPLLQEVWKMVFPPESSFIYMLINLVALSQNNAGYILGGSREISLSLEKRYLELGGKIHYRTRVNKILVDHHRAIGVKSADESIFMSGQVVSAADGFTTIMDLLGGQYADNSVRQQYQTMPIYKPLIYLALGVNRKFEDIPRLISDLVIQMDIPLVIAAKERRWLPVHIYNFDPTLAPEGKTLLVSSLESDFTYWETLQKDARSYNVEKENIKNTIIAALEKRFPGITEQVEMSEMATPLTFHRYTGNRSGSPRGWLMTPQILTLQMKKTLPGLQNFYMIGQWVQPGGGIPASVLTGCHLAQILCKKENKNYCAICPR